METKSEKLLGLRQENKGTNSLFCFASLSFDSSYIRLVKITKHTSVWHKREQNVDFFFSTLQNSIQIDAEFSDVGQFCSPFFQDSKNVKQGYFETEKATL